MSVVLRVGLIVVSILTLIFITRKVRNAQVRLEDSIFWFCVAGLLLILSIFPQIFFVISDFAGVYITCEFGVSCIYFYLAHSGVQSKRALIADRYEAQRAYSATCDRKI